MQNAGTTSTDVKKINRNRIFRMIYQEGSLSKQNIVQALNISLPTVVQNLRVLTERGLVREEGSFASTGGRKARAISCNPAARFSIGMDITKKHVVLVAIDLCASVTKNKRIYMPFKNSKEYFRELGKELEEFIQGLQIDQSRILGVGISVPGLLSEDHRQVVYAPVLGFTGGSLSSFAEFIPYTCILINDASAAALAELWNFNEAENVVYLSLSSSVGGAISLGKTFYHGDNQRSAEFGHMTIVPGGRRCYCGQSGCLDAYCNANILSDSADGSLDGFFKLLASGSLQHQGLWKEYLNYLALAVNTLRMSFDSRVILGGYVGSHMEHTIASFRNQVSLLNSFETDGSYLDVCRFKLESSAVGAALQHIELFIDSI